MNQLPRKLFDKNPSDGGYGGVHFAGKRITFTATAEQLKDVATSANANSLATIFDVQAVQDQMELASTLGDIGALATNVVSTAMQRSAYVALDHAMAEAEANLTPAQLAVYNSKDYQEHPEKKAAYLQQLAMSPDNVSTAMANHPELG